MPRPVSYTIQAVRSQELTGMSFSRQTDGQGGTVLVATGSFEMLDADDNIVGHGSVGLELTQAQRNSLNGFINSVLVPAFNAQEGL